MKQWCVLYTFLCTFGSDRWSNCYKRRWYVFKTSLLTPFPPSLVPGAQRSGRPSSHLPLVGSQGQRHSLQVIIMAWCCFLNYLFGSVFIRFFFGPSNRATITATTLPNLCNKAKNGAMWPWVYPSVWVVEVHPREIIYTLRAMLSFVDVCYYSVWNSRKHCWYNWLCFRFDLHLTLSVCPSACLWTTSRETYKRIFVFSG